MYTFDSIAGYAAEKEELKKLCDILINEDKYLQKGARVPKGLILYGAPGVGKTLFAKVLANECKMPLQVIDITDLSLTQSICDKIKSAFNSAKNSDKLTMIYMDEIDKVLPNLSERYVSDQSKTILTQLLTLIDGIETMQRVFFVASCNDYDDLPSSLVRPGRIDRKINISLPDQASRTAILELYIGRSKCTFEQSVGEISSLCNGLSCSGLEMLVNECIIESDENNFVPARTVFDQIEKIKREDIIRNVPLEERRLNAAHQVGHYVVGQVLHRCKSSIVRDDERVCNSFYDAFLNADSDYDFDYDDCDDDDGVSDIATNAESDESIYFVKEDFLDLFAVLCAGSVGEQLFYKGVTDNCRSDMDRMRWLFINMAESGMFGTDLLYNRNAAGYLPYPQSMIDDLNDIYFCILKEAEKRSLNILKSNEHACRSLIKASISNKVLDSDSLDDLVGSVGGLVR